MINQPDGAFLTASFGMSSPMLVEERLAIYTDGSVWYWSLAAANSQLRNRVGTFKLQLSGAELAQARQIARALFDQVPVAAPTTASGAQVTITSVPDGQSSKHVYYLGSGVPSALNVANDFIQKLLARTEKAPHAVVHMLMRSDTPQIPKHGSTAALFIFESIGTEAVSLLFKPQTFMFAGQIERGNSIGWHNQNEQVMGLVNAEGALVDGIYLPATIAPNRKAAISFGGVIQSSGSSGKATLYGTVEGFIELIYPNVQPSQNPVADFYLGSQTATLQIK